MIIIRFTKSFKIFALLIILFYSPLYCQGQDVTATDINLIHNARVVILSEWHLENAFPQYKRKLIEKLYKDEGVTDLVLEIGKSSAYLLNEYMQSGDSSIIANFRQGNRDYFKSFRNYKLTLGKPIKIRGIDFERMDIVPALKRVLKKTGNTKSELFEYLNTLPDTILNLNKYDMMKAERSAIIQKCRSIYQSNLKYYSSIYDEGYIVKDICENAVLETEWDKRFDAMAHNLRLLYQTELHKYLLIIGMFHVDCPNPIYKELQLVCKLNEDDIVNITTVVKDCVAEAMYQGKGEVDLASSKNILNEPGLVDSLYMLYSSPCIYQLVDIKTRFPNYKPSFKCEYILPIDCKFDGQQCN